jgi:putative addiction module killer protein
MRIDHGPGYRVHFLRRGETIVILLVGGHKASQAKDIDTAKRIAKQV